MYIQLLDSIQIMEEAQNTEIEEIEEYQLFKFAISDFITEMDALSESLPLMMGLVSARLKSSQKKVESFINKQKQDTNEKGEKIFLIDFDKIGEFNKLQKDQSSATAASHILPRTFVVSLVSQYDAFLGDLARIIHQIQPELFHSVDRQMSFNQIMDFENIEDVKESILEKEVESLLRESHYEQLKTLERKISAISKNEFVLTKNLPILPTFIEVTERRNLFVHTNGIISKQYLENCSKHKVSGCEEMKVGDRLHVKPEYFHVAYQAIFEMGVKLAHVLWRKFCPESREAADKDLNNICYDLIINDHFDLAITLLNFATDTVKTHANDHIRKVFVINMALAHYLNGDQKLVQSTLKKEDWSIGDTFKLGVSVLNEDYDTATQMMKKLGKDHDEVDKSAYRDWPLFRKFRKEKSFQKTYKELFDEDFIYKEAEDKIYVSFLKNLDNDKKKSLTNDMAHASPQHSESAS